MGKSNINPFFNNYSSFPEQTLIEDLIIESIGIYGLECWYIPRNLVNYNEVYGEDTVSEYTSSFYVPMYIKNINGFGGDGDFLSKFNIQIRDTVTFTVARRTWTAEVGDNTNLVRPREGDLIWFPLNQKVFIIKFVEHEAIFYQLGGLQTWDLDCELWEYSNERLNTGIDEIDSLQKDFAFDMANFGILTESGILIATETNYPIISENYDFETQVGEHLTDNLDIQTEANDFLDFTAINPIGRNT